MTIRCPSCEGTAQEEFIGDDVRCRCDKCGEIFEWYEQADMTEQNKPTNLHSIDEMLRELIESAFAGSFTRDDAILDLQAIRDALLKILIPAGRARTQLRILSDMLAETREPVSPESAKWFASEIRKYVEWLP